MIFKSFYKEENSMIEGLILIEGINLSEEALRSLSLGNALQLVVGNVPGGGVVLHVAADSDAYFGAALLKFSQVPGVTKVVTLVLQVTQ
jgi:hypothetical protein